MILNFENKVAFQMRVYVIVQVSVWGIYRFVDVKKTKGQASALITELETLNKSVGVHEVEYKVIKKQI